MFKRSFGKIIADGKVVENLPLVGALSLGKLEAPVDEVAAPPITCKNCGCVLLDKSKLEKKAGGKAYEYTCEFCMTKNIVPEELVTTYTEALPSEMPDEKMSCHELSILLEAIRKDKEPEIAATKEAGDLFVATIDISGSMSGGKIEAVKHSLVQTIRDLKVNKPKTKFALVTFESDVVVYSTPKVTETIPDGDVMHGKELLADRVLEMLEKQAPKSLGEFGDQWVAIVQGLRDKNMTALGPAMWASYNLAREVAPGGSKVTLLTDGLANVGMGRIESTPEKKSRAFYEELGRACLEDGIIVDVIGVQDEGGGNQVALNVVGVLSDITGGDMFFITALDIESAFGSIRSRQYVARDTVMRVYTPPEVVLAGISGVYLSGDVPKKAGAPIHLGALDAGREVYLEFKPKGKMKRKGRVPVQIQMEYRDQEGAKRVRVIRQEVEVTDDEAQFKEDYDANVTGNLVLQKASQSYSKSDLMGARGIVGKFKAAFKKMAESGETVEGLGEAIEMFEDEEEEWDNLEKEAETLLDQASFRAAKAQSMYRMNVDDRKKRLRAKKANK
ncbi:MAG: VWA domain-containing protein [Promethearchaeota archaeon]